VPKRRVQRTHAVKAELQVPGLSKAGSSLSLKIYASKLKLGEIMIAGLPLLVREASPETKAYLMDEIR
jgi:hypothetical protein